MYKPEAGEQLLSIVGKSFEISSSGAEIFTLYQVNTLVDNGIFVGILAVKRKLFSSFGI